MSTTDRVVVSTVVAVDPATAFEVFTDDVDLWWRKGPRYRWTAEAGTRIRFEPGTGGRLIEERLDGGAEAFFVGRVLDWKPAERLVFEFRGRNKEQTEVEVRFQPEGEGTRVTVEHRGFDAIPPDHPARHGLIGPAFSSMMGVWWSDLMLAFRIQAPRDGRRRAG